MVVDTSCHDRDVRSLGGNQIINNRKSYEETSFFTPANNSM